jgi:hypothetical protein
MGRVEECGLEEEEEGEDEEGVERDEESDMERIRERGRIPQNSYLKIKIKIPSSKPTSHFILNL